MIFIKKACPFLIIILCIILLFSGCKEKAELPKQNADEQQETVYELETYTGTIEHFFTHCLIAYPNIAFAPGNQLGKNLDEDCLTPKEFKRILEQMYANQYMLVDVYQLFSIEDGRAVKKEFFFPIGKKPIILSFDDVIYDTKKMGLGMVDKLVIDQNHQIAAYTSVNQASYSYDNEFVTILEQFIKVHPDFSYQGARGIMCLTGYDGIFGYRTQLESPNRDTEIIKAKVVANWLKSHGWRFASHSYNHRHMKKLTSKSMKQDASLWQKEVASIVGETLLYVYPYGEWVLGDTGDDARHQVLLDAGFRVFFGVGSRAFYQYMPLHMGPNKQILFMDRAPMDGISLRSRSETYAHVFDCKTVYDHLRPIPYPNSL